MATTRLRCCRCPSTGFWTWRWSPNGRRIAFLRDSQGTGEDGLWLLELLADGDARFAQLSRSRAATNLAYHYDNRRLFYSAGSAIKYIDTTYRAGKLAGVGPNPPVQPLPPSEIFVEDLKGSLSWSPDGRRVAIVAVENREDAAFILQTPMEAI